MYKNLQITNYYYYCYLQFKLFDDVNIINIEQRLFDSKYIYIFKNLSSDPLK